MAVKNHKVFLIIYCQAWDWYKISSCAIIIIITIISSGVESRCLRIISVFVDFFKGLSESGQVDKAFISFARSRYFFYLVWDGVLDIRTTEDCNIYYDLSLVQLSGRLFSVFVVWLSISNLSSIQRDFGVDKLRYVVVIVSRGQDMAAKITCSIIYI